jgi:hypothetical protein
MTASAERVYGVNPIGDYAIPSAILVPLKTGAAPHRYQLIARDATGFGVEVTAVTGLMPMGQADLDTPEAGTTDGAATTVGIGQWFAGYRNSATAGDTFVDADFGRVAWGADNCTIGKNENLARSMMGVFCGMTGPGVVKDVPVLWTGFHGWVAARSLHLADHAPIGLFVYPVDAGAGTALTETVIPRSQLHGTVTGFRYIPSATLAADAVNYKTITISKRTAADPTTAVVLATLTSVLGFTAFTPRAFTLSAVANVLDLLPTDIITIKNAATASGAVVPVGAVDGTMEAR